MGAKCCCKKGEEIELSDEETPQFKPVLKEMRKSTRLMGNFVEIFDKYLSENGKNIPINIDDITIEHKSDSESVKEEIVETPPPVDYVTKEEFDNRMKRLEELEGTIREFVDKPIKIEIFLKEPERSRASSSNKKSSSNRK